MSVYCQGTTDPKSEKGSLHSLGMTLLICGGNGCLPSLTCPCSWHEGTTLGEQRVSCRALQQDPAFQEHLLNHSDSPWWLLFWPEYFLN